MPKYLATYRGAFVEVLEADSLEEAEEDMASFVADIALDDYPHLAQMVAEQVAGKDFAYGDEFEFGLDLILDGLAEQLAECSEWVAAVEE